MKNILIIEDHKNMLEWLTMIVQEVDSDNEIFAVSNIAKAYECTMSRRIDLFLVDIVLKADQMNDVSGLMFIKNMREFKKYAFTPIIIISAMTDPEIYAYRDLHCYGYIEKPFNVDYVKKLVKEALAFREAVSPNEKIYFRQEGTIFGLNKDEIVYAESINHVIHVHMSNKSEHYIRYKTMKKFFEELDNPNIMQCSRSTIVNQKYINNIDSMNNIIMLKDDFGKIDIGVTFRGYFRKFSKSKLKW